MRGCIKVGFGQAILLLDGLRLRFTIGLRFWRLLPGTGFIRLFLTALFRRLLSWIGRSGGALTRLVFIMID